MAPGYDWDWVRWGVMGCDGVSAAPRCPLLCTARRSGGASLFASGNAFQSQHRSVSFLQGVRLRLQAKMKAFRANLLACLTLMVRRPAGCGTKTRRGARKIGAAAPCAPSQLTCRRLRRFRRATLLPLLKPERADPEELRTAVAPLPRGASKGENDAAALWRKHAR